MKHSLIRNLNEQVKLFSYNKDLNTSLKVYKFTLGSMTDITPASTIENLNEYYYSTTILTPSENCYLLILFNNNPIVLRVGNPPLEFLYWSKKDVTFPYIHYDEFGTSVSEGNLTKLSFGFHHYTPVNETLGYIEVERRPYVVSVPYQIGTAGVGINVDWRRTIIRQEFGVKTIENKFQLNIINNSFEVKNIKNKFSINTIYKEFDIKTIKQKFVVSCKN